MGKKPPQTLDKFIVRLPDGMRDRIAEAAEANNRSMNAEIVSRLEWSFGVTEKTLADRIEATLKEASETFSRSIGSLKEANEALEHKIARLENAENRATTRLKKFKSD